MTDKDISPEKAAKIAAIKARLAQTQGGGAAASAGGAGGGGAGGDAAGGDGDGNGGAPAGDRASQIAAIKARLAKGGAGGGAAAAAGTGAGGGGATATAASTDVASRVAALKAKMEAGKAPAAQPSGPAAKAAPARAPKGAPKVPKGRNIYPVEPINRRTFGDERLYGPSTLTRWFGIGAAALLVTVAGMWYRDHMRDWKVWQRAKRAADVEKGFAKVDAELSALDAARLGELRAAIEAAEQDVAARQDEIAALEQRRAELEGQVYSANNLGFQLDKSYLDAQRYQYEEQRLLHGGDEELLTRTTEELTEQQSGAAQSQLAADELTLELAAVKARIDELTASLTEARKAVDTFTADLTLAASNLIKLNPAVADDVHERLADLHLDLPDPGPLRTKFEELRNLPVVDMLARTEQIQQIVLEDLKDNYNFMHVGRIDRCTTCHLGIDSTAYVDHDPRNERGERVLNAHPRLDLFVSDSSPHPVSRFGCTVCHEGRGQAVEFERTFHRPAADPWEGGETAEEKEQRWIADYGYDPERHYWDWPMVPMDKIYSSCFQCHQEQHRLPGVDEYNDSRQIIEDNGCYGCHKIEGFEHLRKVGPDLTNMTSKLDESWVRKWVMDPKGFRGSTRMPHFFQQSNRGANDAELDEIGLGTTPGTLEPQREPTPFAAAYTEVPWENVEDPHLVDADGDAYGYRERNEVEARAIVAYVYDQARAANTFAPRPVPARAGDPEAGQELFEKRGCLGCHGVETEGWTESDHGPDLSGIGLKVEARWLYNWILDPKAYWPETVMPDLRLTEDEAWDITAWLMTQRHTTEPGWMDRPEPAASDAILDAIAVEYKAGLTSLDAAREDVEAMRRGQGGRAVELFVGKKLFQHYGCAGCHMVPGHYDDQGIGTELTKEGLKEVTKLDFGFEGAHENPLHIPHTRHDWFRAKLRDPRVFDRLPVLAPDGEGGHDIVRYEMKVKRPDEKLKMPNFYFSDDEVELATQFLMGLREDGIAPSMQRTLSGHEQVVEDASRLMTEVNCIGCHRIGQLPRRLAYRADLSGHGLTALEQETLEELEDDELTELEIYGLEYGLWHARPFVIDGAEIAAAGDWFTDLAWNPWEEEVYTTLELLEERNVENPDLYVYGFGEGRMANYIADKALRPPTLNGQGSKVHSDWLYDFLMAPYTVRNHVEVRMPTFGFTPDEARSLAHWFALRDDEPWPFSTEHSVLDPALLAKGYELFTGTNNCNSCHPSGDVLPSNPDKLNWGPDLGLAAERLKGDWIERWLHDPQVVQPGTKMPNFFGAHDDGIRQAPYDAAFEDGDEQIEALRHYLEFMEQWGGPVSSSH